MKRTIVFSGGGTGGHVIPGLAVIEQLRDRWGGNIVWIGSYNGMEKRLVENEGIRFIGIPAGKLRRYVSIHNILDIFNIIAGFIAAFVVLVRLKPLALFSKGGYVTVPVVAAARLLRVYTLTHESDFDPGLATRINSRFANKVLVSFEQTKMGFSRRQQSKIVVSGNPVRKKMLQGNPDRVYTLFGIEGNVHIILIIGGSQGAVQINSLVAPIIDRLREHCVIIHQMGKQGYKRSTKSRYLTYGFIGHELFDFMAATDIVVSRAGANMLWEIGTAGKPSILIPLTGSATRGDQIKNARYFQEEGASILLQDDQLGSDYLYRSIMDLLSDRQRREAMAQAAARLCDKRANDIIIDLLLDEGGGNE